uniref:Uncharacterized protein n=1 Tax=Strigamia maritima TaxID=126957 RepID=T1ITH2_STRMM
MGQRPKQKSMKLECTAKLVIGWDKRKTLFVIRRFENNHSHDIGPELYKSCPINRAFRGLGYQIPRLIEKQLDDGTIIWTFTKNCLDVVKDNALLLIEHGVSVSAVKGFVKEKENVTATSKDIHNLRTKFESAT